MISFVNACKTCLPAAPYTSSFFASAPEIRSYRSAIKLYAIALPWTAIQVG